MLQQWRGKREVRSELEVIESKGIPITNNGGNKVSTMKMLTEEKKYLNIKVMLCADLEDTFESNVRKLGSFQRFRELRWKSASLERKLPFGISLPIYPLIGEFH